MCWLAGHAARLAGLSGHAIRHRSLVQRERCCCRPRSGERVLLLPWTSHARRASISGGGARGFECRALVSYTAGYLNGRIARHTMLSLYPF